MNKQEQRRDGSHGQPVRKFFRNLAKSTRNLKLPYPRITLVHVDKRPSVRLNPNDDLLGEFFETSPYENFDKQDLTLDMQGWGSKNPVFETLLDEVQPHIVVEVGTWKGGSAIHMAGYARRKQLKCRIICVDTWLGSLEHWKKKDSPDKHDWFRSLRLKNGYPQLYFQFLYNVIHHRLQDYIIPFPNTSLTGARFLRWKGIQADLIYLDGSHEEEDVYQDLLHYFPVAREGGVIFGDDWNWKGVESAVTRFARERELEIRFYDGAPDTWILKCQTAKS